MAFLILTNNKSRLNFFAFTFLFFSASLTKPPLKVLFVLDEFPKFNQPFVLNQITGLIKRGHEIVILADQQRFTDMIPVDVERYHLMDLVYYKTLPQHINSFDIICCNFGQNGIWATKLKNEKKIRGKLVTIFHGADVTKLTQKKATRKPVKLGGYQINLYGPSIYKSLFRVGERFLAVCKPFRNRLVSLGADQNKTSVHHVGIDCSKFKFRKRFFDADGPIKIVTSCRLVEKKGINYAIKAVAKLLRSNYDVTFDIIGDGKERKSLQTLINTLEVSDKIKILGWKTQEEVVEILDASHIFLLPSVTAQSAAYSGDQEGIPTVLMEAMAMGLPVVSTKHSGIPELVQDGISGYLARERDVNGLVEALEKLIKTPALWLPMGYAGRKKVESEFNNEVQMDKMCSLFYDLCKSKK